MSAQPHNKAPAAKRHFPEPFPPDWAEEWGQDEYGLWIALDFSGVRQVFRWIVPGTFMMGSREKEAERGSDEVEHEVTLSSGYWLADTACTQALWHAVMGFNPSRFHDDESQPVDNVSWNDVEQFIVRLNHAVKGLALTLPTEAQWERACRAGTVTATYNGDLEILGEHNAPVLDRIAWYGGNSGIDYELKDGADSSAWPEKQYDHARAGTHLVQGKKVNPRGLSDMLGNVWEWCRDGKRIYAADEAVDPIGPTDTSKRIIRGGGWNSPAASVRAADRATYKIDQRGDDLGFRCVHIDGT